jgi:hypothetical protein
MSHIAHDKTVPPNVRISAIEALWARGWGRPQQEVKHTGAGDDDDIRITIRNIVEERK